MIKYIVIMTSALLLNGCVYYIQPEKPKEKPLEIIQDNNDPTSYSYPLPDRPKIVNNYVSSEPYPVDNAPIEVIEDKNVVNSENKSQEEPSYDENQPRDSTGGNEVDNNQDQIVGANPNSGSPVGTYKNPITFDQNKVY